MIIVGTGRYIYVTAEIDFPRVCLTHHGLVDPLDSARQHVVDEDGHQHQLPADHVRRRRRRHRLLLLPRNGLVESGHPPRKETLRDHQLSQLHPKETLKFMGT